MRRLVLPALMTLALSVGNSAQATLVSVDNLQLGTGGPGSWTPIAAPPAGSSTITFTGVSAGSYTLDITLLMEPVVAAQSTLQTAAGMGISPGGGGLLDPGQKIRFKLASATVASGPLPFVVFDGYTNFEPDNSTLVDFMPDLTMPEPDVVIENVGLTSFGVALTSLQFTAVPEPSAFLYGGVVAAVAGLGYRGRRWFGNSESAEG